MSWEVQIQDDEAVHVFPQDEKSAHTLIGSGCRCEPRVDGRGVRDIVVHNAFDGREWAERAGEIFNNADRYL